MYVLLELVGEETFKLTISTFLLEFADWSADFKDFHRIAEQQSGKDLDKFFDDWIYGIESSKLLAKKMSVNGIAKRY